MNEEGFIDKNNKRDCCLYINKHIRTLYQRTCTISVSILLFNYIYIMCMYAVWISEAGMIGENIKTKFS